MSSNLPQRRTQETLNQNKNQKRLHPSQCAKNNADVTSSIWSTIKQLEHKGFRLQFHRAQPTPTKETNQPPAYDRSMKNHTEYKTELLEGAACLLRINGHPTVNNEAQELRNAATTQGLRVHLNAKYNWNDTTADEIDWLALVQPKPNTRSPRN